MKRSALLLLLGLGACGATASVEEVAPTPLPLDWVELRTGGAAEGDTLPLIVAMHGRGDRAEAFARTFEGFEVPARVALLRAPIAEGDGDAWFTFRREDTWRHVALDLDVAADRVVRTIDAITATRPTRGLPIAVGFSQGGNLAYTLAVRHPERFSEICPVSSGFVDEALAWERPDATRSPPIVAFHGIDDEIIPIHVDRDTVRRFESFGIPVVLREHPAPHWINQPMRDDLQAELARAIGGS